MIVHGKDIRFALTVGTSAEIAKLCPGGDLNRIGELFGDNYAKTLDVAARFCVALNRGYIALMRFQEPDLKCDVLDLDEIGAMEPADFQQLQKEALEAFKADTKGSVETKSKKDPAEA